MTTKPVEASRTASATESVEEFLRDPAEAARRLSRASEPVVLTEGGRPLKVLMDPGAIPAAAEALARAEDEAAILEGIADIEAGRCTDVETAFARIYAKFDR